jgi:hypothetical protein
VHAKAAPTFTLTDTVRETSFVVRVGETSLVRIPNRHSLKASELTVMDRGIFHQVCSFEEATRNSPIVLSGFVQARSPTRRVSSSLEVLDPLGESRAPPQVLAGALFAVGIANIANDPAGDSSAVYRLGSSSCWRLT